MATKAEQARLIQETIQELIIEAEAAKMTPRYDTLMQDIEELQADYKELLSDEPFFETKDMQEEDKAMQQKQATGLEHYVASNVDAKMLSKTIDAKVKDLWQVHGQITTSSVVFNDKVITTYTQALMRPLYE